MASFVAWAYHCSMSCGGNMMRTTFQPLAHLVDAAAEKWLAVEHLTGPERDAVRDEIGAAFCIGDRDELTFHGARYLLTISRNETDPTAACDIAVHEIALND